MMALWSSRWRGPIPARTGQPRWQPKPWPMFGAYPRSHGATAAPELPQELRQGLSPLARGNLAGEAPDGLTTGPIPARTGQPRRWANRTSATAAYPRSHGATATRPVEASYLVGLSPLARGNLKHDNRLENLEGPIPARTGQPPRGPWKRRIWWAYPRSHGATVRSPPKPRRYMGLSPLARGNRAVRCLRKAA